MSLATYLESVAAISTEQSLVLNKSLIANHCQNATSPSVLRYRRQLLRARHTSFNRLSNQCRRRVWQLGWRSIQSNKIRAQASPAPFLIGPCCYTYLARKEVICVRQMSLSPSVPMYSLADQKVVPSVGSSTVVL